MFLVTISFVSLPSVTRSPITFPAGAHLAIASPLCNAGAEHPLLRMSSVLPTKVEILQLTQALLSVKKMPQDISKVRAASPHTSAQHR